MCDAGIENPKKNVWLNKSIYPLNKTFLLGQKAKNTFFTQEAKPKKKCFHLWTLGNLFLLIFIVWGPQNQDSAAPYLDYFPIQITTGSEKGNRP
jgi:hypothetical protein